MAQPPFDPPSRPPPNRHRPWLCHQCGAVLNATQLAVEPEPMVPSDGDMTICLHCTAVHMLHGDQWEAMTDQEFATLTLEEREELEAARQMATRSALGPAKSNPLWSRSSH